MRGFRRREHRAPAGRIELEVQRHAIACRALGINPTSVKLSAFAISAMLGGIAFGFLSQRIGRRYAIAAACVLSLVVLYWWSHGTTPVAIAIAAFLMQFAVQGAWGVVPAHLNELSPPSVRAILPGFAYQLGNLAVSNLAPWQARMAESHGNDYARVLSWTIGGVAVALASVTLGGREARSGELAIPGSDA